MIVMPAGACAKPQTTLGLAALPGALTLLLGTLKDVDSIAGGGFDRYISVLLEVENFKLTKGRKIVKG